jgi:hypothetical protein
MGGKLSKSTIAFIWGFDNNIQLEYYWHWGEHDWVASGKRQMEWKWTGNFSFGSISLFQVYVPSSLLTNFAENYGYFPFFIKYSASVFPFYFECVPAWSSSQLWVFVHRVYKSPFFPIIFLKEILFFLSFGSSKQPRGGMFINLCQGGWWLWSCWSSNAHGARPTSRPYCWEYYSNSGRRWRWHLHNRN